MIHTSSTAQVATTVPAIPQITIGKASQEPVTARKKVTVASVRVTATISSARTADARTGSGMRRRRAGSSTHRPRPGIRVAAPSSSYILMVRSLPAPGPAMPAVPVRALVLSDVRGHPEIPAPRGRPGRPLRRQ